MPRTTSVRLQITTFFSVLLVVFLPLPAADASSTVATSSSPPSIQELLDTDKVSHPEITLDIGIRQRISRSPQGVAELDLMPRAVVNRQLLKVYMQQLVLSKPIDTLVISEDSLAVTVRGPARLLGVIPVQLPYNITAKLDPKLETLVVDDNLRWWSVLATKTSAKTIKADIRDRMKDGRYLSRLQLAAFLLEAAAGAVTQ